MDSPVLQAIYTRRSIREFTDQEVSREQLHEIVRAGLWAPSGLNNQAWRFVIIQDSAMRERLAEQTHYGDMVRASRALIAVYLDEDAMYDPVKDYQAAGACLQNMLLATEALGLGAVWLGQILKNKVQVKDILGLEGNLDLMAIVVIGHPLHRNQLSQRKDLSEVILKEF